MLLCAVVGVALGVSIFVGLVKSGLVHNPLGATTRGDIELARSERPGIRVLFVGNSLTFYNSMPRMVHDLRAGDPGAPPLFVVQRTAPRWWLRKAVQDKGLETLLHEVRWDVVVLQEQSQLLSLPEAERRKLSFPYARSLQREISLAGARTMLFMTWGYRSGDGGNASGDTYGAMQSRLAQGYYELGDELSAAVAPVGLAWSEALVREPGIDLWASDGRHPNRAGSYLAACVFYETLTGRDPGRSRFTGGLDAGEARFLQDVASGVLAGR